MNHHLTSRYLKDTLYSHMVVSSYDCASFLKNSHGLVSTPLYFICSNSSASMDLVALHHCRSVHNHHPPPFFAWSSVTNGDLIMVCIVTDKINFCTKFTFHENPYGRAGLNSSCSSEILNKPTWWGKSVRVELPNYFILSHKDVNVWLDWFAANRCVIAHHFHEHVLMVLVDMSSEEFNPNILYFN